MPVVYHADHLIDAHLVRGMLENAGIPVEIRGEHLVGAIGELSAIGLVTVWVADNHRTHAEQVLEQWRSGQFALPVDEPLDSVGRDQLLA